MCINFEIVICKMLIIYFKLSMNYDKHYLNIAIFYLTIKE